MTSVLRSSIRALRVSLAEAQIRRAVGALFVFSLVEYGTWVAILVWAFGVGGAPTVGLVAVVQLLPAIVVAPLAASLGDRYPRDRVLRFGYATQAAAAIATGIAIAGAAPIPLVLLLATVANTSFVLARPTHGALLPQLAGDAGVLVAANAATTLVLGAGALVGPIASGLLLDPLGPGGAFVALGLALLGGAAIAPRLRRPDAGPPSETEAEEPHEHVHPTGFGIAAGVRLVIRDPTARVTVGISFAHVIAWGALDLLIVSLALETLRLEEGAVGYLTAAIGLGGLLGGALSVLLAGMRRLAPAIGLAVLGFGLPLALVAAVASPVPAAVLIAASALAGGVLEVASLTLLQRVVPERVLTRVLGVQEGLAMAALAIGAAVTPVLIETVGVAGAFIGIGLLLPVVGLVALPSLARIDRRGVVPSHVALLRGLDAFAPLDTLAIERLARALEPMSASAGTVLIRRGAVGDRFYIVEMGSVMVVTDGQSSRTLGPGDGFGEIALLLDIPRTATVTALTDVTLLALGREPFLAALDALEGAREAAIGIRRHTRDSINDAAR
jgi:MFS family permease